MYSRTIWAGVTRTLKQHNLGLDKGRNYKLITLKYTNTSLKLTTNVPAKCLKVSFIDNPLLASQLLKISFYVPGSIVCRRTFHKTSPKRALPPILWIVIRQLLKFGAIITGRGIKKWWARLPNDKKKYFLQEIKKNRSKISWGMGISGCFMYIYYLMHLVEDPITKRKKFLIFSEEQILQMSNIESEAVIENFRKQIVTSGSQYNRVLHVARKILNANKDLPGTQRDWKVLIIDDPDTTNAFVLPSGHIFIFTGMLKVVNNDDQLAAIIGHEMAHALLSHSAEVTSKTHVLELLLLVPIIALWTLLPDSVALSSHYFTSYISAVLFQLPFSRLLETEADAVGLEMMAKACFDPRQASAFWKKMEKMGDESDSVEFLSTHPSHKTRYQTLDSLMPKIFRVFTGHCGKPDMDPRVPSLPTDSSPHQSPMHHHHHTSQSLRDHQKIKFHLEIGSQVHTAPMISVQSNVPGHIIHIINIKETTTLSLIRD